MKKIFVFLFSIVASFIFSETDPLELFRLGAILDNGIMGISDESSEMIAKYKESIEKDDLTRLYFQYEKESRKYAALNFLVGFGAGSLFQGDESSAKLFCGIEIVAVLGSALSISMPFLFGDEDDIWTNVGILSGSLVIGSRLGGLFQPGFYADKYNSTLSKILDQE